MKNIWHVKPIKIHFGFDTDRDDVKDRFDCRPFNPQKQHITPNKTMAEEIKSLPIYVSDATQEEFDKLPSPYSYRQISQYHVLSRGAKQKAPVMRRTVLSILKKYPNIIGMVKRRQPNRILFTKFVADPSARGFTDLESKNIVIQLPSTNDIDKAEAKVYLEDLLLQSPERYARIKQERFHKDIFQDEPEEVRRRKSRSSMAWTTFHELEHVKQVGKTGYPALREEYDKYRIVPATNPFELEADEEAIRQIKKRELPNKKYSNPKLIKM